MAGRSDGWGRGDVGGVCKAGGRREGSGQVAARSPTRRAQAGTAAVSRRGAWPRRTPLGPPSIGRQAPPNTPTPHPAHCSPLQLATLPRVGPMNATLAAAASPRPKRKGSVRRPRAASHLPPVQTQETHDLALQSIRAFLKGRASYDAFPVSFRLIVLDSELEVKKALQCLLTNGAPSTHTLSPHPDSPHTHCLPRRRLRSAMEQREISVRRNVHGIRHHPSHPVLLPHLLLRQRRRRRRNFQARIPPRCAFAILSLLSLSRLHLP